MAHAATPAIRALVAAEIPHEVLRYHHDPLVESFGDEAVSVDGLKANLNATALSGALTVTTLAIASGLTIDTGSGGNSAVEMTPAAERHPRAEEVRLLLQKYFDAINSRDYAIWTASVSSGQSQARPEDEGLQSYSTTKDTKIKVHDHEAYSKAVPIGGDVLCP